MVIDSHTHIDELEAYNAYMKKAGNRINKAFVLHWYKDDLEIVAKFVSEHNNLQLLASVDIGDAESIQKQLETIEPYFKNKTIIGIKLYPGYQHFYPSDPRIHPIAELCLKYKKPLVFHSGDVCDPEGRAILKYANPVHIDDVAIQFPDLKIVIAHFGFPYLSECANVVSKNENVYTDISGTIADELPKKEVLSLYDEYKKDLKKTFGYFPEIKKKIMFGTDYSGEDAEVDELGLYIKLVKQLFTSKEQDRVFGGLAKKLFLE